MNSVRDDTEEENSELLIEIETGGASQNGVKNKRLEVIRDENSYEVLFRSASDFKDPPMLGKIDFDRYQVVVAFRGLTGSISQKINIISVKENDMYYEVTIENTNPCFELDAIGYPYSFKMIPAKKEVIFREVFVVEECSDV